MVSIRLAATMLAVVEPLGRELTRCLISETIHSLFSGLVCYFVIIHAKERWVRKQDRLIRNM